MSGKPRRFGSVLALVVAPVIALSAGGGATYGQSVNPTFTRTNTSIQGAFSPIVRDAAKSTVRVQIQEKGIKTQAALGTIISDDGYILTKGSEVIGRERVVVPLAAGGEVEAKIVGYNELLDLAMLKVDAKNLVPVKFADTRAADASLVGPGRSGRAGGGIGRGRGVPPTVTTAPAVPAGAIAITVGEWVATPDATGSMGADNPGRDIPPRSVGVISTSRRSVRGASGFLGVSLGDAPDAGGARIMEVVPQSAAAKAGLKADDVVMAMEGRKIKAGGELAAAVRDYTVGDSVRLWVKRGDETLVVRADLGENVVESAEDVEISILSGDVSKRSTYFPAVFQHDTILKPSDMGGPLVDLEGHVIGINIARAGRTETYALPADVVLSVVERLKSGVVAPLPTKPSE